MKFFLDYMSNSGGRLGRITNLRSNNNAIYETPMCCITTRGGSVPHLTPVCNYQSYSLLSF